MFSDTSMNAASTERRKRGAGARVRDRVYASAATITAVVLARAIGMFWVAPIGSSLWLDEMGTVWAIRGTLRETIDRAFYPGQPSVLFSVVTWLVVAAGGLHEITLRVPSLGAGASRGRRGVW